MTNETDQERVARLCVRAQLALQLGMQLLERAEGPCDCRYPDGRTRYVDASGRMMHRCGR